VAASARRSYGWRLSRPSGRNISASSQTASRSIPSITRMLANERVAQGTCGGSRVPSGASLRLRAWRDHPRGRWLARKIGTDPRRNESRARPDGPAGRPRTPKMSRPGTTRGPRGRIR
jgi:hypothetical protein